MNIPENEISEKLLQPAQQLKDLQKQLNDTLENKFFIGKYQDADTILYDFLNAAGDSEDNGTAVEFCDILLNSQDPGSIADVFEVLTGHELTEYLQTAIDTVTATIAELEKE